MRKLPNTTGFDGYGETSWEAGGSSETSSRKVYYQDLIRKANTVPLTRIFKYYNLRINEANRVATCPFKSHKGGRESSPSFNYYHHTNSFRCFGCSIGGEYAHACEFMASMEGITTAKAAHQILDLFKDDIDYGSDDGSGDNYSYSESLEIMVDFSNIVREFRQTYLDEKSQQFIEETCRSYDEVYAAHTVKPKKINNEALRRIVDLIKNKIANYKLCLTL